MAKIYDFHKSKGELEMRVYSSVDVVSQYFLSKSSMSHKKLQKLVYYAYAWTLALLNDREDNIDNMLFTSKFEAWVHGPVCPELYHKYKVYGWEDLPKIGIFKNTFPSEVIGILDQVWQVYGGYSGDDLEHITHKEQPWIEARKGLFPFDPCNNNISNIDIYRYYNKIANEG